MDSLPFRISNILGLFPYDSGSSKFKTPMFCYSAIFLGSNILGGWYIASRVLTFSIWHFQLMEFLNVAMFQFFENLGYAGMAVNLIKIATNKPFLREMSGSEGPNRKVSGCLNCVTTLGLVLTVIGEVFCVMYEPTVNLIAWFFTHGIYRFMYLLICVQYCTFIIMITEELKSLTVTIKSNSVNLSAAFSQRDRINSNLFKVHSVYSYQLFLMSVDVFFNLVFLTYFFYFYVVAGGKPFGPTTQSLMVVIISMFNLLLPSMTVSYAINVADAFNYELYRIVKSDRELCRDKKLVMVVKTRRTVKFTAGGFIVLGNEFIVTMVAAVTTYLVTLVQCSQLKSLKQAQG